MVARDLEVRRVDDRFGICFYSFAAISSRSASLFRAKYGNAPPDQFTGYKRVLLIAFFSILVLVTVIVVLTRAGLDAENDPLLDPMNNPNIRVAAVDGVGNSV